MAWLILAAVLLILSFSMEALGVGWTIAIILIVIALIVGAVCLFDDKSKKQQMMIIKM